MFVPVNAGDEKADRKKSQVAFQRGAQADKAGHRGEAIAAYSEAIAADAANGAAWRARGKDYLAAGDQAKAPDQPLPGPGEPVGFAAHIKPLFREHDRQSMSFAFDLWSYDDVRARGTGILARLSNGSMPCDGAWPAARIEVFQRWISTGMQP